MKDICKNWLQVITACLGLSATAWGQAPVGQMPYTGGGQPEFQAFDDDFGSVRLGGGDPSASASVSPPGIQQTYYQPPASPMFRDVLIPEDDGVGFAMTRLEDRALFRVGHNTSDQYGFNGGFTNIGAFIPLVFEDERSLWWVNPRVNITDYGQGAGNLGFGYRTYNPGDDRVYGASLWYDFDSGHSRAYHSLGGSFESIGRYASLRFNFDLPVGQNTSTTFDPGLGESRFQGTSIVVDQRFRAERAYQEYDFEVATPFPFLGGYGIDLGVGFYYLHSPDAKSSPGVSVRTQAQINDNFWINGVLTNDDIFDTNASINFELTMPSGGPMRWFSRRHVSASLTDSVQRRYRVPVAVSQGTRQFTALNPKTGEAYVVAHVDPNLNGAGSGAVDSPFGSIEQFDTLGNKGDFDIIYVRPRNDQSDTNLNTGITLLSGQQLLSNSVPHFIQSTNGVFQMPGYVADQALPLLTRSGVMGDGHVVNLETGGMCFHIAGFDISNNMTLAGPNLGGVGSAIFGEGVSEVVINRNILRDAEHGTLLTDFSGSLHFSQNVLRDNTVGGMSVEYTGDGQLALFSNSTFNNVGIGFEVIADGATITANNLPPATAAPPAVNNPDFSVINPALDPSNPILTGQFFPMDPTEMWTGIVGNVADLNETGMLLEAINGGQIIASVESNTFSNNQDITSAGLVVHANGAGSQITLETFQNNLAEFNVGSGVILASIDGGTINTPLQADPLDPLETIPGFRNNSFESNDRDGLSVIVENSTMDNFVIGFNNFSENRESGLAAYIDNSTIDGWDISLNNFDRNARDGLAFILTDSAAGEILVSENAITNNGGNGINLIAVNSTVDDITIENNFIQANGAPIGGFNIDVVFLGGLTPAQQAQFTFAARRWEQIIVGDLPDVFDPQFGLIDDILITAEGVNLGPGILGQATFTAQRNDADMLPYLGLMEFSTAFLPSLPDLELRDVILHEMAHVLGFHPGLWQQKGLLDAPNALFLGAAATAEHNAIFGLNAAGVPLQTGVGPGSDLAHWDDALYGDELMTFSATGTAPRTISRVTAAQFQDLGYVININAADQNFPLAPGGTPLLPGALVDPSMGTIAANQQKLAAYMLAASTLPVDAPGVVLQRNTGGNGGVQFDLTDSVVNATLRDNVIDQNSDFNLRGELRGASTLNLESSRDQYTASQNGNGVEIITRNTSFANIDLQNATITENTGDGVFGNTFNASQIDMRISSPTDPLFNGVTVISANGGHGVNIISSSDAPSSNTSNVNLLIEDSVLVSNGQSGVNILSREFSTFDVTILDNLINSNGGDGIEMTRQHDGFINGTIIGNDLIGNGGDGINLLAQNAHTIDTYLIQDNLIRSNTRGIHLRVEADAIIDAIINNNLIELNSSHGIHVTDRANSALDQRYVTGVWTQNTIRNNGGSGIQLDGSYGDDPPLQIGLNGVDADGFSLGNVIHNNNGWGIQSTAVGLADIENNEITSNGLGGINIDSLLAFGNIINIDNNFIVGNTGIGIEMRATNNVFLGTTITNNTIAENTGDGIEIATLNLAFSDVLIDNNLIFINGGRGIDILNAGFNPNTITTINNNVVNANDGEGVYVVNTSSASQYLSKDGPTPNANRLIDPTHGMDATGSVLSSPYMVFNMDSNIITNNGVGSQFDATGFVMRVGTSDGGRGVTFEGGYASDGFGGVIASVTNNVFSGNYGTDVWFESFTSTVNPITTSGTWNQNEFTINPGGYQSDPLARLDLVFSGNSGDSIQVTNVGAWYSNAEPQFKSRGFFAAPNLSGPFAGAGPNRRRNAQRLASRDGLAPFVGPGLQYLYPGMGTSTFRIAAGTTLGLTGSGADNEFNIIGTDFNSIVFPQPVIFFGELGFDWDTISYTP